MSTWSACQNRSQLFSSAGPSLCTNDRASATAFFPRLNATICPYRRGPVLSSAAMPRRTDCQCACSRRDRDARSGCASGPAGFAWDPMHPLIAVTHSYSMDPKAPRVRHLRNAALRAVKRARPRQTCGVDGVCLHRSGGQPIRKRASAILYRYARRSSRGKSIRKKRLPSAHGHSAAAHQSRPDYMWSADQSSPQMIR